MDISAIEVLPLLLSDARHVKHKHVVSRDVNTTIQSFL